MLGLAVCRQKPRCQPRHSLRAPDLLLLPLLEGGSHPRHLLRVGHLQVSGGHSTGLEFHPNNFIFGGVESHPIKEDLQCVQGCLEAGQSLGIQELAVHVKECCKPLDGPYETTWVSLLPCD